MDLLNEYSPLIQAVSTVILVIITGLYVRHTSTMVEAMQEEARPYVSVRLAVGLHSTLIGLEIRNSGVRTAYSISIVGGIDSMDVFQTMPGSNPFFRESIQRLLHGIASLAPGEKRFYPVATFRSGMKIGSELVIDLKYSRDQSEKRSYTQRFEIKADEYIGTYPSAYMADIDRICTELDKVADTLRTLQPEEYRLRHLRAPPVPRTKACTFCKQMIPIGASVCFQCQRDLPDNWDVQNTDEGSDPDEAD